MYSRCTTIARHACRNSSFPTRARDTRKTSSVHSPRAGHNDSSASRPARVPRNHFPRCNPRAVLEIKNNRFPLHKRPVSTSPFPLTPAFLQSSASDEMSALSRPDLPTQSGRAEGIPVGAAPLRANLSDTFPFVGKGIPRAGSAKLKIIDYEKSEAKFQSFLRSKTTKK